MDINMSISQLQKSVHIVEKELPLLQLNVLIVLLISKPKDPTISEASNTTLLNFSQIVVGLSYKKL